MPAGPAPTKVSETERGVERRIDLYEFLLAAGDLESKEYQRGKEEEEEA